MSKPKTIRTIADLQSALLLLIGGQGRSAGKRQVVETHSGNSRSVMTFFVGEVYWRLPEHEGGPLFIHQIGDSPADAYRKCCLQLRHGIEERARKRRLSQASSTRAIDAPPLLRITYQPTEAS